MFDKIINFIRETFNTNGFIPLHEPRFVGNEKKYLEECIDSTYVSYVGAFVERFENLVKDFSGSKFAISTANGTLALHLGLITTGVLPGDEVLTQALTFVATANAIKHAGAEPIFVDSEREYLGMSPEKLEGFLAEKTVLRDDGYCYNKKTGRRLSACVPVHVFGHPLKIDGISTVCEKYRIPVIEDAAESLGSNFMGRHTGTFGCCGILSFNGNKIVTTGGGGMVLTDNEDAAKRIRHLATTAKIQHEWDVNITSWTGEEIGEKAEEFKKRTENLRPFCTNHILISYPIEQHEKIMQCISALYQDSEIEIESSANG